MDIKYRCVTCEKTYMRKSSYDKHRILCDFLIKSKQEKKIICEESRDLPNYMQLVNIVQELSIKYITLETQMTDMKKWVEKKKKKINVVNWLNDNMKPLLCFSKWLDTIQVEDKYFEFLLESPIIQTMQSILEENVNTTNDKSLLPIKCFSQKSNLFYVYDVSVEENEHKHEYSWRVMAFVDFAKLLKHIQSKLLKLLLEWKNANKQEIDTNDNISILYNKTIIKLMNISFAQDSTSGKIRSHLYNYLKTDLKNLIEYDFEF